MKNSRMLFFNLLQFLLIFVPSAEGLYKLQLPAEHAEGPSTGPSSSQHVLQHGPFKKEHLLVPNAKRDHFYLFQMPRSSNSISHSVLGLATEFWFTWNNIPYFNISNKFLLASPSGHLPFAQFNGKYIEGFKEIIQEVEALKSKRASEKAAQHGVDPSIDHAENLRSLAAILKANSDSGMQKARSWLKTARQTLSFRELTEAEKEHKKMEEIQQIEHTKMNVAVSVQLLHKILLKNLTVPDEKKKKSLIMAMDGDEGVREQILPALFLQSPTKVYSPAEFMIQASPKKVESPKKPQLDGSVLSSFGPLFRSHNKKPVIPTSDNEKPAIEMKTISANASGKGKEHEVEAGGSSSNVEEKVFKENKNYEVNLNPAFWKAYIEIKNTNDFMVKMKFLKKYRIGTFFIEWEEEEKEEAKRKEMEIMDAKGKGKGPAISEGFGEIEEDKEDKELAKAKEVARKWEKREAEAEVEWKSFVNWMDAVGYEALKEEFRGWESRLENHLQNMHLGNQPKPLGRYTGKELFKQFEQAMKPVLKQLKSRPVDSFSLFGPIPTVTDARLMAILYHFFEHLSNIEDLKTYFRRSRSQHHANGVTMIHSTEEGQYLHRNYLVPILNSQLAGWPRIFDAMRERPWPMNSYIGAGEKYNGPFPIQTGSLDWLPELIRNEGWKVEIPEEKAGESKAVLQLVRDRVAKHACMKGDDNAIELVHFMAAYLCNLGDHFANETEQLVASEHCKMKHLSQAGDMMLEGDKEFANFRKEIRELMHKTIVEYNKGLVTERVEAAIKEAMEKGQLADTAFGEEYEINYITSTI